MLMQLLLIVAVVIAILWPAYWLLTRRRLPVRRKWSWRRVYVRTLDRLIDNRHLFALVVWSPVIAYLVLTELLQVERNIMGWAVAGCCSVIILVLAVRRGLKWMMRASRPADQARARWHDRILSREYRTRQGSKRFR